MVDGLSFDEERLIFGEVSVVLVSRLFIIFLIRITRNLDGFTK